MPKIIENLRERLTAQAAKQLAESGYAALTVRSVAGAAGVGVGTVYNYFPSKDALVASVMLDDWNQRMRTVAAAGADSTGPEPVLRCMYGELRAYAERYRSVFLEGQAAPGLPGSFRRYHAMLRDQLAGPLRPYCQGDFAPQFIAEALLAWTMEEKTFDEIYTLLQKIF